MHINNAHCVAESCFKKPYMSCTCIIARVVGIPMPIYSVKYCASYTGFINGHDSRDGLYKPRDSVQTTWLSTDHVTACVLFLARKHIIKLYKATHHPCFTQWDNYNNNWYLNLSALKLQKLVLYICSFVNNNPYPNSSNLSRWFDNIGMLAAFANYYMPILNCYLVTFLTLTRRFLNCLYSN